MCYAGGISADVLSRGKQLEALASKHNIRRLS